MAPELSSDYQVRPLTEADLAEVARIDAAHTGYAKEDYWQRIFHGFFGPHGTGKAIAVCIGDESKLQGYLFGEVRMVEFGSEPCGWVFAVAVDRRAKYRGVGSALLRHALAAFQDLGVDRVRTMVRRNDVPVLSFFRANRFVGGPYVQLELGLDEEA